MRNVAIDTAQLGTIMVRSIETEPNVDPKSGVVYWRGQVLVPGVMRPSEVRLRINGVRPSFDAGAVRVTGEAKLVAWYVPAGRGQPARTDITLSVDGVAPAEMSTLELVGRGLPAILPPHMLVGKKASGVIAMLDPGHYDGDGGVIEIDVPALDEQLTIGNMLAYEGLSAVIRQVDNADAGRYGKAEIRLSATRAFAAPSVAVPAPKASRREESVEVPAS